MIPVEEIRPGFTITLPRSGDRIVARVETYDDGTSAGAAAQPSATIPRRRGTCRLCGAGGGFPAGRTRKQLAVLAGYKASGSTFRGAIAELRKRGYASPSSVEPIAATPEGLAVAPADALPTGRALYEYWRRELPEGARKLLDVLYVAWPNGVDRTDLAERTGYDPFGSTYRGAIAALRNVDLATPAGVEPIKASDELMENET